MTKLEPGDVILVSFPFSDLSSQKLRPALVVNPQGFRSGYDDIVLMPLTSRQQPDGLELSHWQEAGLLRRTWLKLGLATIHMSVVRRKLGRLHDEDIPRVVQGIRRMIASRFLGPDL